jgi:hypothetical protein
MNNQTSMYVNEINGSDSNVFLFWYADSLR